jgi:hypothetical protein
MRIRLDLQSPALAHSELFARAARLAIEACIMVNRAHLRRFPNTPPLYSSGIRYRMEPDGVEDFTDYEVILRRGWGDCAQLVAARVAELREQGEPAGVRLTWQARNGRRLFHVQVRRADGRIEDPSVLLGMNSGDGRPADKHPVIGYRRKQ